MLVSWFKYDDYGSRYWYVIPNTKHRKGGPAVEHANGTKLWFYMGDIHWEDGPAVEWEDGTKGWYLNGKPHREDGPAIEWVGGNKEWYRNGRHQKSI